MEQRREETQPTEPARHLPLSQGCCHPAKGPDKEAEAAVGDTERTLTGSPIFYITQQMTSVNESGDTKGF